MFTYVNTPSNISRRARDEIVFRHALRLLSESEYEKIFSRVQINGNTKDYFRVNGIPYVVGESAERHGLITQRTGAARYTKEYCGVLAPISLFKLYGRGSDVARFLNVGRFLTG